MFPLHPRQAFICFILVALVTSTLAPRPASAEDPPQGAPEGSAESTAPEETPGTEKSPAEIAVWSLAGVAATGLIAGGIFGLTAIDEKRRYEENPEDDFEDRRVARAVAADVSFAVAGAAAFAALVVWLATGDEWESAPEEEPAAEANFSLTTDGTSLVVTF